MFSSRVGQKSIRHRVATSCSVLGGGFACSKTRRIHLGIRRYQLIELLTSNIIEHPIVRVGSMIVQRYDSEECIIYCLPPNPTLKYMNINVLVRGSIKKHLWPSGRSEFVLAFKDSESGNIFL